MERKARSFLTILSIFIGITTIFIFVSFGWGLFDYVESVSSSSAAELALVQARGGGAPGLADVFALTEDDLEAVQSVKGVYEATGAYFKAAEVKQGENRKYVFLIGYDPDIPLIMNSFNIDIDKGRKLDDGDDGKVLLGYNYQVPNKIFPKGYKTGDSIEVQGQKLKIVGFFKPVGNPQDDSQMYVINGYIDELYDEELNYGMIVARLDKTDMKGTIDRIKKEVRQERDLEEGKEDFFVSSYEDLMKTYLVVLNVIVGFIVLIGLISVLVSAVNTANTMITSVLERVREIGVIKSIGARNKEIFKIFLFESSFLGFVSGVIGVFFGWVITFAAGQLLDAAGWGFLSPHYSFLLFFGCIMFATLTGAVSGVIPAYKASRLKPVDALRYE
ncbi:MAG TPA: ABC transporter permease [Candidatus Nanoarchaeia archaeon]|nr:ABC transporter permease [Candidatus Nanoarchaeia archaeon]